MPGAICDSSTLIHLAKIKRLHLLRDFHKDIFIAPAVWREVVEPANRPLIHFLQKDLHDGESETRAGSVSILM